MGIPAVTVKKSLVGGAPAIQTNDGILAILASASTIPSPSLPTSLSNQGLTTSTFGSGMLPESAVYMINATGKPVVAQAVNATITGSYYSSTFIKNVAGTSVVTTGSTHPYLHYAVVVTVVTGGTVGSASPAITYTYSLDGGNVTSAVTALGTANTITLPNTGVSFNLGAGTLVAGDNWSIFTERPLLNNSDISTALVTLGQTKLSWEGVLIDSAYVTGTVALVDEWLAGREANGQFNFALLNARFLLEPTPSAESPTTYATAITAQSSVDASNRLCLCADGGHMTSLITGYTTKFPTSLALAAMTMAQPVGVSPAEVDLGPVPGFTISASGNPNDWDEFLYQALNDQRIATLRSFPSGGPTGCFITQANVLISGGSDIVYLQLLRVLNKACSISWQILNTQLSKGVQTIVNATTGAINIKPSNAQTIEQLVNSPLRSGLRGQVTGVQFSLNRDDDLSVEGAPVNGQVAIAPLFYLGNIVVTASLVKSISANGSGG